MENIRLIDTHTHYAHPKFDNIRNELLSALPENGIAAVIEAAIGYESNKKMMELCEQYPYIYAAVGIHPSCIDELDEEKFEELTSLLTHEKVVAIGETGLDYSKRGDDAFVLMQKKWFVRFIELALQYQKPLVIHCRDVYDELIEIMSAYEFGGNPGIIHCFSGSEEQARRLIDMGFLLGIGGKFLKNVDKNQELKEVIRELPIEKIVLETDAPYLKPDGILGKYNTSLNLGYIAEELAKLKGLEVERIYEISWKNTLNYMKRERE